MSWMDEAMKDLRPWIGRVRTAQGLPKPKVRGELSPEGLRQALDTVGASHNLDPYVALLKRDGTLCLVGVPEHPHPSPSVGVLIFGRKAIAGSLIGGLPETQEMLDFCAEHGIVSDIEMIGADGIDEAYERMLRSDVKYRFVIDIGSMAA